MFPPILVWKVLVQVNFILCIVYGFVFGIVYSMGWRNKALAFSATLTFSQRQQKKLLLQMPALINLLPASTRENQQDSNSFTFVLLPLSFLFISTILNNLDFTHSIFISLNQSGSYLINKQIERKTDRKIIK